MLLLLSKLLVIGECVLSYAGGTPVPGDGTPRGTLGWIALLSAVVFVSILMVAVACLEGGCWPLRYFRRRDAVAAVGIENPLSSDSGGGFGLSEMDVRALELDPIVFEPLPTLSDITHRRRDFEQMHLNGKQHLGAIVPFSSPESHIYAHDWFDEPLRNFPRGNVEYIRELGKGWFGQVIEGEAKDIVPYAKKMRVIVKALRGDASDSEQMRFLDESRLYRDSTHGNILKLLGHSIETNPFLLLMEYCALGDLKTYLMSNVSRAEVLNSRGDVLKMALDIAKGLEWMAASDLTHGDLAARNCQVGSEGRILIGDYGLSTHLYRDDYYWSSNIAVPLRWAAPETLHCTINTIQTLRVLKESNVWTFGVILWEICEFGKLPYFELNDEEVISRVITDKNYVLGGPTMPSLLLRDDIYNLMTVCWSPVPSQRPAISSIVQRLQFLIEKIESIPSSSRKGDDFDNKWKNAPNTSIKRKSVSFSGDPTTPHPPVNFALSTPATPTEAPILSTFSKTLIQFEPKEDPFPSLELWKTSTDPEEEDFKKRIERGEITQKVREKSESVQDLMILTHVEPSDLSLEFDHNNGALDPFSGISLRRASSETALNIPISKSSHGSSTSKKFTGLSYPLSLGGNSSGNPYPTSSKSVLTPANNSGTEFRFPVLTPNPAIQINIIQPTPIPINHEAPITLQQPKVKTTSGIGNGTAKFKRRFVFRDEDESQPRRTSTPKRSLTASTLSETGNPVKTENSGKPELFTVPIAVPSKTQEFCNISAIADNLFDTSIKSEDTTKINNTTYTVSSFGAMEEFSLEPFQGVTSSSVPISVPPEEVENNSPLNVSKADSSWLMYTRIKGSGDSEILSLAESADNSTGYPSIPKVKVRFQEEIAGANDEVGSLLLHDLEAIGEYHVIREDREIDDSEPPPSLGALTTRNAFGGEVGEESLSLSPVDDLPPEPIPFVPSKWDSSRNPAKPSIKSPPETGASATETPRDSGDTGNGIRKSVSFERKKRHLVYEYPPPQNQTDSDEEEHLSSTLNSNGPMALSLDWELNPDEMDDVVSNEDDWDFDSIAATARTEPKSASSSSPHYLYRISPGNGEDSEPNIGLGGLRHTRQNLTLKIGLNRSEADDENTPSSPPIALLPKLEDKQVPNPKGLDIGPGATTNVFSSESTIK